MTGPGGTDAGRVLLHGLAYALAAIAAVVALCWVTVLLCWVVLP